MGAWLQGVPGREEGHLWGGQKADVRAEGRREATVVEVWIMIRVHVL